MRALVYSDLQATEGDERCFGDPNLPLQQHRVTRCYEELRRVFDEYECDCLWDLGDTTDDRSAIPMPTINAVLAGLDQFPDHPLNIKLIGNHEQFLRNASIHVGKLFERKFHVVSGVQAVWAGGEIVNKDPDWSWDGNGLLIMGAAFPASYPLLQEDLKAAAYKYRGFERRLLLGHFQMQGCQMASGWTTHGVEAESLKGYTRVLLGHIHRPQELMREKISYVGSPFQQNFGEKGEEKRVGVVDLDELSVQWVPMTGFPEYRTCSFLDFLLRVNPQEEHRYEVYLRNQDEAERYFAHPLMNRAKAIYDFKPEAGGEEAVRAWSRDEVMRRYLEKVSPEGIDMSEEEMLEMAALLVTE